MRSGLALVLCVFSLLAGCGGGDGDSSAPPAPPSPPASNPDPVIGASGGTVTETNGASIVVPAGALSVNTTIRIARDSTGAPAIPASLTTAGSMYVITPHGGDFAEGVEVRIPAPAVTLQPNQEFKLAKAQPGGEWLVLDDTEYANNILRVHVSSFSFFTPVIITYLLPIAQFEPLRLTATLDCGGQSCSRAFGAINATYTVTSNNGQPPQNCTSYSLGITAGRSLNYGSTGTRTAIPLTGGSVVQNIAQTESTTYKFGLARWCGGSVATAGSGFEKSITWVRPPTYPYVAVLSAPAALDIVEGATATLDVIFGGGASRSGDYFNAVSDFNRTVIEWERSDNNGASWRVVARSYENEANPMPFTAHEPWFYWSVRHVFTGTIADQGALIRAHACFTPRDPPSPPCATGPTTRLNVLQQSAAPTIVSAPRSVLIRTGQTASFSVSASGLPSPTLRWQTRAANSNGAWSDVTSGNGGTTANYTTPTMALADNGTQFRAVATNSMGSADSAGVTVSVSDIDVAPAITTQPASLSVASGSDAVFAVDARGTEALSYQWYRNSVAIAGANSSVLRLTGVNILNSGTFYVRVSNEAGNANSNGAVLNVFPGTPAAVAPTIVTQPASLTVNVGNTATFAVGVDGSGPFTFQWRKDGVDIPLSTSALLTLPGVTSAYAGSYSVVVSNSVGPAVTSSVAALTVSSIAGAEAPTIVTQPSTIVVAEGGSAVLAVGASGSGPLSYQWARDGVPINGETAAVLVFAIVHENDAADFSVTVSNSLGSVVSHAATVILLGAPVIWTSPSDVHAFENSTTTFRVDAAGPNIHYQWLRNGAPIAFSDSDAYTTPSLTVADSGAVYSVIVFNGAGVQVSAPAVLTVTVPAPPTVLQQPADVTIQAGALANLCMAFGGTPPFNVQMNRWVNNQWAPIGSGIAVNDNGVICISTPNLQLADSGTRFIFFASNAEGGIYEAMTREVTVTVTAPAGVNYPAMVSRATSGAPANNRSYAPSLSADGNLVAFISDGTNLVPGYTNYGHAYVRNVQTGVTAAIDRLANGAEPSQGVGQMKLAAGGRYVVFTSLAQGIVASDTNNSFDVFVRDLETGTTEQVTLLPNGSELTNAGNASSDWRLDISADGRFVTFSSFYDFTGSDGDQRPRNTLFLRDMVMDQTRIVVSDPVYDIAYAAMSSGSEYIAYTLSVPAPFPAPVMLYDYEASSASTLFSLDQTSGNEYLWQGLSISGNGRLVAFGLRSNTLLGTAVPQVVVVDRDDPGALTPASASSWSNEPHLGDGESAFPKLSYNGRYVLFNTSAPNLTGIPGGMYDRTVMVRDLQNQTTIVASRDVNNTQVRTIGASHDWHAISDDLQIVAFVSDAATMGDGNFDQQVYLARRPSNP